MLIDREKLMYLLYILVGIKVEIKVSTTGYSPLLYKNEQITIECTATEYAALLALHVRGRGKDDRHGCTSIDGELFAVAGLLGPSFPDLTRQICESSLQPTTPPSTLRITGTVTEDLAGLQLYCYAADASEGVGDGNLVIDTIRGELLK